jgi:hypothetical protein
MDRLRGHGTNPSASGLTRSLDPDCLAADMPFRPPLQAAAVHYRQATPGGRVGGSQAGLRHAGVAVADLDADPVRVDQHADSELGSSVKHGVGHQLVRGHDQDVDEVVAGRSALDVREGLSQETTGPRNRLRVWTEALGDDVIRRHLVGLPVPVSRTRVRHSARAENSCLGEC